MKALILKMRHFHTKLPYQKPIQLNHLASLAKWLSVHLRNKWLWVQVPVQSLKTSSIVPVLRKELLDIQATAECGFTLKRARDKIRTYSQMHLTNKYSQNISII